MSPNTGAGHARLEEPPPARIVLATSSGAVSSGISTTARSSVW